MPILDNQKSVSEIKSRNKNRPKWKHDIKTTIGVIIGFVITSFFTQPLFKPSFDKKLIEFAENLNKSCPMDIDEGTVLENIAVLPNKTVQYNYSLKTTTKAEVKIDTVKKYFFPSILANVRSNIQMKLFRDNKVTLNYNYKDKNGVFVFDYIITPEMYSDVKD